MVVEAIKPKNKLVNINVSKIVKSSFNYTIEEDLPVEEPVVDKSKVKYITFDYAQKLDFLSTQQSSSYRYGKEAEYLSKKDLLKLIDRIVTKDPRLFKDIESIDTELYSQFEVICMERLDELEEYLELINARDEELNLMQD